MIWKGRSQASIERLDLPGSCRRADRKEGLVGTLDGGQLGLKVSLRSSCGADKGTNADSSEKVGGMKVEFEVWVDLSCWVFNGCSNGFLLKADYVCHILLSVRHSLMRALDMFLSSG